MDEYISREEAKQFFNLNFGSVSHAVIAARLLDEIPAADVVEVVRCKDCDYFKKCKEVEGVSWTGFCRYGDFHTDEDDFCSRGKRKEGDE